MKKIFNFSLLIIAISFGAAQTLVAQTNKVALGLTKEEQKVMDYIDANMPRANELLKESVNKIGRAHV